MRYSPSEPLVSFSLPSVGHQPLDILDFLLAWGCVPLDLRVFDGEGGGASSQVRRGRQEGYRLAASPQR